MHHFRYNILELLKSEEAKRFVLHTLVFRQLNILTLLHQLEKKIKTRFSHIRSTSSLS